MNEHELWKIVQQAPTAEPVFWRLYYDNHGHPIIYSMENLPGTYIDVDPAIYARAPFNVRVHNGKLIEMKNAVQKLYPSDIGTPCYPNNVAIIVDESQTHQRWSMKTNETN